MCESCSREEKIRKESTMQAHQSHVYRHSIDYCVLGIGRESIKTRSFFIYVRIYSVRSYGLARIDSVLFCSVLLYSVILSIEFVVVFICASFASWPNVKATGFLCLSRCVLLGSLSQSDKNL